MKDNEKCNIFHAPSTGLSGIQFWTLNVLESMIPKDKKKYNTTEMKSGRLFTVATKHFTPAVVIIKNLVKVLWALLMYKNRICPFCYEIRRPKLPLQTLHIYIINIPYYIFSFCVFNVHMYYQIVHESQINKRKKGFTFSSMFTK